MSLSIAAPGGFPSLRIRLKPGFSIAKRPAKTPPAKLFALFPALCYCRGFRAGRRPEWLVCLPSQPLPDKAIRLLSRQIRGLQDNGVAATIKHFPGDGVDYRDQHLLTTSNSLPFEIWKQYHGKVFKALIDSGVAAIMPGHITLPSWQEEKIDDHFLPATLSKELLTNLLKGELGFNGVIVSDAMVMGGFRGWYDNQLEGEIQSFLAGVDE